MKLKVTTRNVVFLIAYLCITIIIIIIMKTVLAFKPKDDVVCFICRLLLACSLIMAIKACLKPNLLRPCQASQTSQTSISILLPLRICIEICTNLLNSLWAFQVHLIRYEMLFIIIIRLSTESHRTLHHSMFSLSRVFFSGIGFLTMK